MTFKNHTELINIKLSSGHFAVRTVKKLGLQPDRSVYYALVESHLRHGIAFWKEFSHELFNTVFLSAKESN